ncbi:hypothetical protein AAVH_00288 [Aphelenchoides avenae]|nr:hypothetical protein AAVH_00288 [Aphelenchus avenae]
MSAEARRYYLSLLGEERKKLEIVELGLDLATLTRKLDIFLAERMPHISALERSDLLDEFLTQSDTDLPSDASGPRNSNLSTGQLKRQQAPACSSKEGAENTQQRRGADLQLARTCQKNMCVYVLRLEDAISKGTVRWAQLPVEEDAPEDAILFSLVAGRGELILFGGMRTDDGNGMDSLNVGFERHAICADTYILRPRYNEL